MLTTLFVVELVTTQASGSTLTLQRGTMISQPFLDKFQKQVIQQMRQGLKSRNWTVSLELVVEQPEEPTSSATTIQELIFEKEHQAVLNTLRAIFDPPNEVISMVFSPQLLYPPKSSPRQTGKRCPSQSIDSVISKKTLTSDKVQGVVHSLSNTRPFHAVFFMTL